MRVMDFREKGGAGGGGLNFYLFEFDLIKKTS